VKNRDQEAADAFLRRLTGAEPEPPGGRRGAEVLARITGSAPRREDEQLPQRRGTDRLVDRAGKVEGAGRAGEYLEGLIGENPTDAQDQVLDHGRRRLTDDVGTTRGPQQGSEPPKR